MLDTARAEKELDKMDVSQEEGGVGKKKKTPDFSAEAESAIREAQALSSKGKMNEAIETLLRVEKKARLAGDPKSVLKCAKVVLRICNEAPDFEKLNHFITLLW